MDFLTCCLSYFSIVLIKTKTKRNLRGVHSSYFDNTPMSQSIIKGHGGQELQEGTWSQELEQEAIKEVCPWLAQPLFL